MVMFGCGAEKMGSLLLESDIIPLTAATVDRPAWKTECG